ncbi:MAG: recombinase family protein [Pseudomonadota bacterium]
MGVWPELENTGRKIGYARVSTKDQKLDVQLDALKAMQCDKIYKDHGISGAKSRRPGLDSAMKELREGDVLIVYRLCRLGRSVQHLADSLTQFRNEGIHFCSLSEGINTTTIGGRMVYHIFAAIAEFQRELIIENTLDGLQAARDKGKTLGRPRKLDLHAVVSAHQRMQQEDDMTLDSIADLLHVSPSTVSRAFRRYGLASIQY